MSPTAIALVLAAAIAHASWNLFGKQAAATGAAFFIWLVAACVTVGYLPVVAVTVLVTHPHLTGLNWLFLAGTGVLHSGYFLFLQLGYRLGDLSVAYPIGRGTGAMLAALAGVVLLGERPSLVSAAGILAIIAGVVVIGLPGRAAADEGEPAAARSAAPSADRQAGQRARPGPVAFALATGVFIACYTIWDKYAVSSLDTEPILQGYAGFPVMAAVFTPVVLRDRQRLARVWQSFRPQVLGAALLSPLAYILVLIALSFTAVSAVAPAREVSVLFGVLLGRRLLGEGALARRLAAAAAIVAGIIAVAVG
ncbi:MAG TPA: EamA family transporter [Streptosporangiaceae bacterium]|nr:EamA family transporter [Streptosporangiaceae bacterium]